MLGEIGNGATVNTLKPAAVTGISGAVSVRAGGETSCAVLGNGAIDCWGSNVDGQLGDGTPALVAMPASVVGL